jgi:glycerol-3-phosphate acyltransferase PlsX
MRIAVDAMGGDFAPEEVVKGAVEAAASGVAVQLVGPEPTIAALLKRHHTAGLDLSVRHAEEVIEMRESPAVAVRTKRGSSLVVGIDLVKNGEAGAFVSAGNSGAVMAAALLFLGRIGGIERPALSTLLPGVNGRWLLIDAGANVDCKPLYLQQFALMGSVYCERVLGISRPTVALLSNGEEDSKGSQLVVESHRLLRATGVNFVGNIDGHELPQAKANVVVTDGFVGNIVLKFGEGVADALLTMVQQEVEASLLTRMAAFALLPALRRLKRRVDYAEYGGAPLLGVNGVCIVAHGRSKAKAIRNAILMAKQAAEQGMVGAIREGIDSLEKESSGRIAARPTSRSAQQEA